jgi:hypothetical protein
VGVTPIRIMAQFEAKVEILGHSNARAWDDITATA